MSRQQPKPFNMGVGLTLVAAGAACGYALWRTFTLPEGRVNQSQAQSLGYANSQERERVLALAATARKQGRWSTAEMSEAQRLYKQGGKTSREMMINAFGAVSDLAQHQSILDMLEREGAPSGTEPFWRIAFRKWQTEQQPPDRTFATRLQNSKNETVRALAPSSTGGA